MRKPHNLINKDGSKIEFNNEEFYIYNEYNDLVPIYDITSVDEIILSNSIRYNNINEIFIPSFELTVEKLLNKQPKTNSFSIHNIIPSGKGILVSQGPNNEPIWKSFSAVFPGTIYKVISGEAIIIENDTMKSSSFKTPDISTYIYNNTFINRKSDFNLETISFYPSEGMYSGVKTSIQFTPELLDIIAIDGNIGTNGNIYKKGLFSSFKANTTLKDLNEVTIYVFNSKYNSVKSLICSVEYINNNSAKFILPKNTKFEEGDDELYLGDVSLKTSLTFKSEYKQNFLKNKLSSDLKVISNYNVEVKGENNGITANIPLNINVKDISLGHHHGFYINEKNDLIGFGYNAKGEISKRPPNLKCKAIACSEFHNVAILTDGSLISWGSDEFNQVSDTPSGNNFEKVYCHGNVSAAISKNNELFIWGDSFWYNQYLDTTLNDIQEVAFGEKFMLALTTKGDIIHIGDDNFGQGTNIPKRKFIKIAAGKYHCAAIDENEKLYVWGSNNEHQLNNVEYISSAKQLVCTDYGGGVIMNDGRFRGFGNINSNGNEIYDKIISGYLNVVLLKKNKWVIKKEYDKIEFSGDKLEFKINFEAPNTVLTSLKSELDLLLPDGTTIPYSETHNFRNETYTYTNYNGSDYTGEIPTDNPNSENTFKSREINE